MKDKATTARRLIVADVENLLGCEPQIASDACWDFTLAGLTDALGYDATHDHLIVGVDPRWAFEIAARLPQARLVVRSGESGADLALCDELSDSSFIAERYDGVVIASGDHAFIGAAATLAEAGVTVTVAGLPTQMSGVLAALAHEVVWVTRPALVLGNVATVASAERMLAAEPIEAPTDPLKELVALAA